MGMFFKYISIVILYLSLLAPNHLIAASKIIQLSSGEKIEVTSLSKIYATGSKEWVLILNYTVESIDDRQALRDRAELIWDFFRPIVEKKGYANAGIKAIEYIKNPDGKKSVYSKAYTHVIRKNESGIWRFIDETKKLTNALNTPTESVSYDLRGVAAPAT